MDNSLEAGLTSQNTRLVVIGNERYPRRAMRVMEHLRSRCGWIGGIDPEMRVGVDYRKRHVPGSFREMQTWPHWWAASCDHIDALEDGLVSRCHHLLVLEDDASLTDDFDGRLRDAWQNAGQDWKAIRLGWNAGGQAGMIGTLWSKLGMSEAYDYFQTHRHRVIDRAFADLRAASPRGWSQTSTRVVIPSAHSKQCGHDA